MKIATKIRGNCLFLVALVLLIGILDHREVTRIGNEFDRAINRTQAVVTALQDIRFHAMHLTALAHGHRERNPAPADNPPGASAAGAYLPTANALSQAGERHLDLISRFFPAEVKYADPIREAISDLHTIAREMERPAPNDATSSRHTRQRLEVAVNKLLVVTERSLAAEAEELRAHQLGVAAAVAGHSQALLIGTATVVIAGLLVGAYVSRRLSRPVGALRELAAGLGAGNLGLRAEVRGKDDISELARALNDMAQALSRTMISRQHIESIIDCVDDGVLVTDSAGLVQRANQAARNLLADAGRPLIGAPLTDLLPGTAAWLAALIATPTAATREIELPAADAPPHRLQLRAAPMRDGRQTVGLVLTMTENFRPAPGVD